MTLTLGLFLAISPIASIAAVRWLRSRPVSDYSSPRDWFV